MQRLVAHIAENKLFVGLTVAYFLFQFYTKKQARRLAETPVEGSKVKTIVTVEDFDKQLLMANDKGTLIVVDFFATWCPPCLAATPIYAKMSKGLCVLNSSMLQYTFKLIVSRILSRRRKMSILEDRC